MHLISIHEIHPRIVKTMFPIIMHAPYESNNREIYTAILEQITDLMYFIILPSIYLINSHDFKTTILDSKLYLAFTNKFFFNSVNKIVPAAGNNM